jgi:hypothetical protein
MPLIDRVFSSEAPWDWRLIIAVLNWCCPGSILNDRKACSLNDHEILTIYGDSA